MKTIIFIGMAGVGKSTIGKLISRYFKFNFIDIDHVIENDYDMTLDNLIKLKGEAEFIKIESKYVLDHLKKDTILSPGGSLIYAEETIESIKNNVIFIYLYDDLNNIIKRIPNLETRGIIGLGNEPLTTLFNKRNKLYKNAAHAQFNINHLGFNRVVSNIKNYLKTLKEN